MRAVLVGLGPHGHRILGALREISDIEHIAVVDRRAEALGDARVQDLERFEQLDAALAAPTDLVCVATTGPSHAPIAIQAMRAGVGKVFIEKPLACSLAECDSIATVANETGAVVTVDHPRQRTPAYQWARDQILARTWGDLRTMWIQRPGIGLGCLATHSFDLVRFLSGRHVRRVTAWVDPERGPNARGADFHDPGGLVVLELDGGARAIVAQIEDGAGPMSVEMDLTGARVVFDERTGDVEVVARNASIAKKPDQPARYERLLNPQGHNVKRDLRREIEALLRDIVRDEPAVPLVDGIASIEVLAAAHLSHQRGNVPVELPLHAHEERALWLPVT